MFLSGTLGDPIVYWILRVLLLLILVISGYYITNIDLYRRNKYWKVAIAPIMSYSLFYGLRWMRGADYYHYALDIEKGSNSFYINNSTEFLYRLWCDFCSNLHILPEVVFTLYAALFICGIMAVLKHYPKAAMWVLPMAVLITGGSVECHFRQYFALSFLLFAYSYYLDNKKVLMYLFFGVSFFIHYSTFFPIIILLLTIYIKDKVVMRDNYLVMLVIVYLLLLFFWDLDYLLPFANWLGMMRFEADSSDIGLISYIENSDRWFTDEGSLSILKGIKMSSSFLFIFTQQMTIICVIITGYKAVQKMNKLFPLFVFTYFSYLLFVIAQDVEMIDRIGRNFSFFTPLMLGIGVTYSSLPRKYLTGVIGIYLFYYVFYLTIRQFGTSGEFGCAFIWDK